MFLLLRMSLSSGFNVALPPSTVHLPEMFWVSGVMVTRICKRGGAKLPSHRAKVFCHHYVSCDHTVRGGVGRVRGGRGVESKTHSTLHWFILEDELGVKLLQCSVQQHKLE